MKNAALRGNPHGRFGEGEVASYPQTTVSPEVVATRVAKTSRGSMFSSIKEYVCLRLILVAMLAICISGRAIAAAETIRANYVSMRGSWSSSDREHISPVSASLDSSRTPYQVFTATPPAGHQVTKWLWNDSHLAVGRGGESDMSEIVGSDQWCKVSEDKMTCTVNYRGSGSRALGIRFDYIVLNVKFDGNGATSGRMSDVMGKNIDSSFGLERNGFAKTGYHFIGWRTNQTDGVLFVDSAQMTGTDFWNGSSFDSMLYAQWEADDIEVSYDANGGRYSDDKSIRSKSIKFGSPYGDSPETPTRGGYNFKSWQMKSDGGVEIKPNTVVSVPSNHTLYAKWESVGPIRINVSWDARDREKKSSGTVVGGNSYQWGETCILQATPSTGSRFVSWADGETANPRSFAVTEAKTFTAWFDLEVYKVTFRYKDADGNDVEERQEVQYGYPATAPTVVGYKNHEFDGWSTDFSSVKGDLEVVARYVSTILTVSFDGNGGTVTPDSMTFQKGSKYEGMPTPNREGYTGTWWWTNSTGGERLDETCEVRLTGSQTLYAHWTANNYIVSFETTGGVVSPESKEVTFDSFYGTLPTPVRRGYKFDGWFSTEGGNVQIDSGTRVKTASDHKLWAHWTEKTYTLWLDRTGGEGGTVSVEVHIDKDLPKIDVPAKTGNMFGGYFEATEGGGIQYYTADGVGCLPWNEEFDRTLYAKWTKNKYDIVLDQQGGFGGEQKVLVTYSELLPTLQSLPMRTGYKFDGYYAAEGASGGKYYSASGVGQQTWMRTENGKLYANWIPISYRIIFDANGGSGTVSQMNDLQYDGTYQLNPTGGKFVRANHDFLGWSRNRLAIAPEFSEHDSILNLTDKDGDVIALYAVWRAQTYTVAFDSNGATNVVRTQVIVRGVETALSSNEYVKIGYRFGGWAETKEKAAEQVKKYEDQQRVKDLAEQSKTNVLYAVWNTNAYYVAFDANGGTGTPPATMKVFYDQEFMLPEHDLTPPHYHKFLGWDLEPTAEEPMFAATGKVSNLCQENGKTNVLYAIWKLIPSDLSRILDCDGVLYFEEGSAWVEDQERFHFGGSSLVHQSIDSHTVSAEVPSSGTLSFWWMGKYIPADPWWGTEGEQTTLVLEYNGKSVSTNATEDMVWQKCEIRIDAASKISFAHEGSVTCWIDHVTWTPDPQPEPTDEDAVKIGAATAENGKFRVSFASDARFDYNLLTNADLKADGWGVRESKSGTGEEIVFEPEIDAGQPQLFYKVETVRKRD